MTPGCPCSRHRYHLLRQQNQTSWDHQDLEVVSAALLQQICCIPGFTMALGAARLRFVSLGKQQYHWQGGAEKHLLGALCARGHSRRHCSHHRKQEMALAYRNKVRTGQDSKAEGGPGLSGFLFTGLWTADELRPMSLTALSPALVAALHLFAALCSCDPVAKPVKYGLEITRVCTSAASPTLLLPLGHTPHAPLGRFYHHPYEAVTPAPHTHLPLWW